MGAPWKKRKKNLTNVLRQEVAVTFSAEDKKTLDSRQIGERERTSVRRGSLSGTVGVSAT